MLRPALYIAVVICLFAGTLRAQDPLTRIYGTEDQQIPVPSLLSIKGQKDSGALQEFIAFVKTTQLAGLSDLRAQGTAVLPEDEAASLPAILLLQGATRLRLDIQTRDGVRTLLVNGTQESVRHETKGRHGLPAATAAWGSLAFTFPGLIDLGQKDFTLVDRGLVTVDGSQLHRLSLQIPFSRQNADKSGHDVDVVTDLYFTPSTHLLVKSASFVILSDRANQSYLRVTSYEDYRQVNGVLLPFQVHETLNGQREWTLRLSDVQLNPGLSLSSFQIGQ